uniref:Uncharacterized protein n=1 Tax=viral metagenome TaxID=1070528 RepID=A0A6M3M4W9_9ZZZZ
MHYQSCLRIGTARPIYDNRSCIRTDYKDALARFERFKEYWINRVLKYGDKAISADFTLYNSKGLKELTEKILINPINQTFYTLEVTK